MRPSVTDVLVIGASGLVGQHLLLAAKARGFAAVGTSTTDTFPDLEPLDLADANAIPGVLDHFRPSIVLLAAAMTTVDGCERDPAAAQRINADAPGILTKECAARDMRLVYYSTDYVFEGSVAGVPENAPSQPLSVYGRTKRDGEKNVLAALQQALVIRTCANFGWNRISQKDNSVTWILNKMRRAETVPLFTDQWVSPSYAVDVARATLALLDRKASGIFHVATRSCLTRLEMGQAVADVFGLPSDLLEPSRMADARFIANRPAKSCLAVDKVERTLNTRMRTFRDSLEDMRETE